MQIHIRVENDDDDSRFIDLILTYRSWVPGNDPWAVSGQNSFLRSRSGDWYHVHTYDGGGTVMGLSGLQDKREFIHLKRTPHWPPSEFKVGDSGPAYVNNFGSGSLAYINESGGAVWTITGIA